MKYTVIGAGGTGGILGAALSKAGYDVTLIARGEHLAEILEHGLAVHDLMEGTEAVYPVSACTEEEYEGTCDVVFVCVKDYAVPKLLPFIDRITTAESLIVPVLNIFTTGEYIRENLPGKYAVDGCIYVSANIEEPGKILQHSRILRVVYGPGEGQEYRPVLEQLKEELENSGAKAILSQHIRRDALKKFCYVSPIGAAGLYYKATAGDFQKEGVERELYIGMMREIEVLAAGMGCPFNEDVIGNNLTILAHQPKEATTSLQRDVYEGKPSELKGLILDIPALGEKYHVDMPLYRKMAAALAEPDSSK